MKWSIPIATKCKGVSLNLKIKYKPQEQTTYYIGMYLSTTDLYKRNMPFVLSNPMVNSLSWNTTHCYLYKCGYQSTELTNVDEHGEITCSLNKTNETIILICNENYICSYEFTDHGDECVEMWSEFKIDRVLMYNFSHVQCGLDKCDNKIPSKFIIYDNIHIFMLTLLI